MKNECQMCGGRLVLLGALGAMNWYRCRNCGIQFSRRISMKAMRRKGVGCLFIIALLFLCAFTGYAQDDELAGPVKNIKAQYEKALKVAQDKETREYIADLTNLKDNSRDTKVQKDALIEIEAAKATLGTMVEKVDPIVGKWRWGDGRIFSFGSDGSISGGKNGSWAYEDKKKGSYRFSWGDTATVSKDGKTMPIMGTTGKYTVKRVVEK